MFTSQRARIAFALTAAGTTLASPAAAGPEDPAYLQWFETPWDTMAYRMPDFYVAGYNATWLPPVNPTADQDSPGYDPFDRFSLDGTVYGDEGDFIALVDEFHRADSAVYIDWIMNHNSGRTDNTFFQDQGGWPGFWLDSETPAVPKGPTDSWGDFHNGDAGGFFQSENPQDPQYDVLRGDLVGLIDIAHASNNEFIRHPVEAGNPDNIPGGTTYNLPDAGNRAFYPDLDLPPVVIQNPGTPRNPPPTPPGFWEVTIHPYNTQDPMAGDPVIENASALLTRATQRMLDVYKVDGFRLDAAKHIPSWFWDNLWDNAVYMRRTMPDGSKATAFSFVESVTSNVDTFSNYTRKDGFGNRDALDLNGAGALRNIIDGGGFGSWNNVIGAHIDNTDDGFNNGTLGMNHVLSHDNGSAGDGGAAPPNPALRPIAPFAAAYTLLRPGPPIIYHNGRAIPRASGFFPRAGYPYALGTDVGGHGLEGVMPAIVQGRNMVGRGDLFILNGSDPVNPSIDDVLVFERRTNGVANMVAAFNDSWAQGRTQRFVQTSFPPGTRLREIGGVAGHPIADPNNDIDEVLVVDGNGFILIPVPHNANSNGVEHGMGFTLYAPTLPTGAVTWSDTGGVIPPDDNSVPSAERRRTPMTIVRGSDVRLQLTTSQTDPQDPNTDDFALFKINSGYTDFNDNGQNDFPLGSGVLSGYEQFLTTNAPLFNGGIGGQGVYEQAIDTTQLDEGVHYVSVIAFRHRPGGTAPLFREWREVIFVDNISPQLELLTVDPLTTSAPRYLVQRLDDETDTVHMLYDLPAGTDPIPLLDESNKAARVADDVFSKTFQGVDHGFHSLTVVGIESITGATTIERYDVFVNICNGDIADSSGFGPPDGQVDFGDFFALSFLAGPCPETAPGCVGDLADSGGFGAPDGKIDFGDFFALSFVAGPCP